MKVKEFIEELKKCNQEKEIMNSHFDGVEQWDETPKITETEHGVYIE